MAVHMIPFFRKRDEASRSALLRRLVLLAFLAVSAGAPYAASADETSDFVERLPDGVEQVAVLAGPAESALRFVVVRSSDHDRLFVQRLADGKAGLTIEIAELRQGGERVTDIRSEAEGAGISAFVDTVSADDGETTYELFLDSADRPTYIFRPATN